MILTEFDSAARAVINPDDLLKPVEGIPGTAVACYSHITFQRMIQELDAEIIAESSNANGVIPIYKGTYKDRELTLFMIDVGAPMSVGMLEELGVKYTVGKT